MHQYFEDPIYLWWLVLIPILVLLYLLLSVQQKKRLRKFGDSELVKQLMPDVSRWRPLLKFVLMVTALFLLIIVFARPHLGVGSKTEKRSGIETIIAMDISNSMRAKDIEPSRLDRSKMMVENLVDQFSNDKIGLIVFAGDAFVQLPMTSDYVSAKMFLSTIDPSLISTQGTDIAAAIDMAVHSFSQDEGVGKAIVVITDGEDHEGGAVEAAADAKKRGMRVYVLGVGSTDGSPIPDPVTGHFMTDDAGETVMSALNEDMCKQVAEAGGGAYIHVTNSHAAQEQLDEELDKLAKKEISTEVFNVYEERFVEFALVALLLLVAEVCIMNRKSPFFSRLRLFGRRKSMLLLLLLISTLGVQAQTDRQCIREGNRLFRSGNYPAAEVQYRKAVEFNKKNPQAIYNLGNALMAQKKDSMAVEQFERAAQLETNPYRKYLSYHNIGVICQSHQMFQDAIKAYKEALRLNPRDNETRYNLEVCKRQLKRQPQNGNNGGNSGNNDQQDDQNKKKPEDQNSEEQRKKEEEQRKKDEEQRRKEQREREQNPQMSRENAEQLLNAAILQERETQRRMQEQQQQGSRRRLKKNW